MRGLEEHCVVEDAIFNSFGACAVWKNFGVYFLKKIELNSEACVVNGASKACAVSKS